MTLLHNPKVYYTTHEISQTYCSWVVKGFGYPYDIIDNYDNNTNPISYGNLRGCYKVNQYCKENNKDYISLDYGYFGDRNNNLHLRITKNAREYKHKLIDVPNDRFNVFNIDMKEYHSKKTGKIVVLPPSSFVSYYDNLNYHVWFDNIKKEIQKYTDEEVVIKLKTDGRKLVDVLSDARICVHYSSMGAIDALLLGIPIITIGDSLFNQHSSTDISEINNPKLFDRQKLFNNLAYNQFSSEEIISGKAKSILTDIYREIENG